MKRINIIDLNCWLATESDVKEMEFGNSCETERIKRRQNRQAKVFKTIIGKTICKGDSCNFKASGISKTNVFDALLSQKRTY